MFGPYHLNYLFTHDMIQKTSDDLFTYDGVFTVIYFMKSIIQQSDMITLISHDHARTNAYNIILSWLFEGLGL